MSKPVNFEQENTTFSLAEGGGHLPAYRDEEQVISCWELTEAEKAVVAVTGKIYLSVLLGGRMVPSYLSPDLFVNPVIPHRAVDLSLKKNISILKALRIVSECTVAQMAQATGCSKSAIYRAEKTGLVSPTAVKCMRVLGYSSEFLDVDL